MTDSRASFACQWGATQNAKASLSESSNEVLIVITSSSDIPYEGSSSEWKIPATPANFAALASSLPRRGS